MRTPVTFIVAFLLLALLLQGCGHKGPLYLPQAPATPPQSDQNK